MLDELRALIALESEGTISGAAVSLRLTQSAITKRIQSLEATLGYRIVEPDGRRLKLSSEGLMLLAKAKPLLIEIEGLRDLKADGTFTRTLAIGVADSIASSWGPKLIKQSLQAISNLDLEVHVHRSTTVIEKIRTGRYELGLVAGLSPGADLVSHTVAEEPMVLVGKLKPRNTPETLLCIEPHSATWREIGNQVTQHQKIKAKKLIFLESFSAAVQMAKEGFGQALVPLGLVKTLGLSRSAYTRLTPKIDRRISLVTRKSVSEMQCVRDLYRVMKDKASTLIE